MSVPEEQEGEWRSGVHRPVFGTCPDGTVAQKRLCGYAIVLNDYKRLAVIYTPNEAFLPGGGCESGESPGDAAIRETLEEAGLIIELIRVVGVADQYVQKEGLCVLKESTFYLARSTGATRIPVEANHHLKWQDPEIALPRLHHESHAWAIRVAISR